MDQLLLFLAIGAVGFIVVVGAFAWQLHGRPYMRRRYERRHFRSKRTRDADVDDRGPPA